MNDLITPEYKAQPTDITVRYELASLSGEAFQEYLILLSEKIIKEQHTSSKIHMFDINQATKEWSVSFDESCFEEGNLGQHLHFLLESCQMSPAVPIEILDIKWTKAVLSHFPGPQHGLKQLQDHFSINDRPLLSGILGTGTKISNKEMIEEAYHMWMGGCDIVSEKASLKNTSYTEFEDRICCISKEMTNCRKRTGKHKEYVPQISGSCYEDILIKIQKAEKHGISIISIDEETVGLAGIRSLSNNFGKRGIFIISAGFHKKHLNKEVGLKCSRLIGSDGVKLNHIIPQDRKVVIEKINKEYKFSHAKIMPIIKIDNNFKDFEYLIKDLGPDIWIESNTLIKSHPDGIKEGASAVLSAIRAASKGLEQKKAAQQHRALKKALDQEIKEKESQRSNSMIFAPL
jgi:ribulose 1,5-bisphosphate carboxylase large subunit-like protein